MRLLRRKTSRDRERAVALSARGVSGVATIVALRATGATRTADAREVEITLDVDVPGGPPVRVVHTQFVSRFTLHGLAPGERARVLYDRDDPRLLLVRGHPRLRTEVVAGEIVIAALNDRGAPGPAD